MKQLATNKNLVLGMTQVITESGVKLDYGVYHDIQIILEKSLFGLECLLSVQVNVEMWGYFEMDWCS